MDDELRGFLARARAAHRRRRSRWASASARPAHVAAIGAIADGVIVASELIRRIDAAPDPAAAEAAVEGFCAEAVEALRGLAAACRRDRRPRRPAARPSSGCRPATRARASPATPRRPAPARGPSAARSASPPGSRPVVVARLRAAGVDARRTPGRVTPLGARGAVFISLHHDAAGGRAGIGHAISGAGENWYHGEGFGTAEPRAVRRQRPAPRPRPACRRPSSAAPGSRGAPGARPSAPSTRVANGAHGAFGGVEPRDGNVRMMRFYGFYRTRAGARVLLEAGAPGVDDVFLRRLDPIAAAVTTAITRHLGARGLLAATGLSRAR